ncbi:A disintegrin and metalloproteinase with thrombospondin motifs 17 [Amblyraja radiata]|uniref:A disintegrin and metalloproteinase with thrombospondin motifs 17 n=1 Tax=Amblyraja radiata TaxID=386614 RepID=UPI001401F5BB|nr:A disintegrin and metalloproteinase with thrombospondin motifs 17 [Amblyraja radiata]
MGVPSLLHLALAVCLLHFPGPAAPELTVPRRLGSGPPGEQLQLALPLPAWGTELVLSLRRGQRFLAPAFTVEERGRDTGPLRAEHHCFYSGHVLRHRRSFAALSTCNGLLGYIQIGDDLLSIEPVNKINSSFSGEVHRIYRHKQPLASKKNHSSDFCKVIKGRQKLKRATDQLRRNAIRLTNEYTVETLVVADSDMVEYHGAEAAQRFLLTVMNMVYNMFRHRSLGIKINIQVTKLVLLHKRPEQLSIGHHGEKSLESFCHWQQREFGARYLGNNQLPGGRDDYPAVDAAMLVTRTDFCVNKNEPCDTVGIAYLGGACNPKRKCVLAEDNGLSLAFTIAHELGHNLGMSHDDDHSTCAEHFHIMSGEWIKGKNPSDLSWSACSHGDLESFLRSKASTCLLETDPRSQYATRLPPKLPGMHYSADEQCQILFGINATFCKEMEHLMCSGLWCLVEEDLPCKTKLDPPLDGTECGVDKWCRAGKCVSKTPIPEHLDGDWNSWSQWSMCSRTCGTGARFRQRKCDNPPPGPGGTNCLGVNVEHKVCENVHCNKGQRNFRDQQCQSQDRQGQKKRKHWTAVLNDDMPCALFCSPFGKDSPVLIAERVQDGTPCGPYETDLCVNGKCKKIGCDGIIGSAAKEDRCGVCNGDDKSCEIIKGDFNQSQGMGYVEAAVIPAGARRIRVVEEKPAHSFLALKDSTKQSINSDWKIELPGEFPMAGTTVHYVRRGLWEKMSAKGPTKTPLHLMVLLFHDKSYGIHYEYTIPVNKSTEDSNVMHKPLEPLYLWTNIGWGNCSVQCGGGERRTIVRCSKIVNKTLTVTNDSDCRLLARIDPQVRRCNIHPCQSWWVGSTWSPCSRTCGKGTQIRNVTCVYQLQNGTHFNTRSLYCLGPRLSTVQGCEGRACLTIWEASDWSKCSSDCGRGTHLRTVNCTNPHRKCDLAAKPREEEECEDHSNCYKWRTGEWSKCSSTCGKGLHSRVVQCMHRITGRHGNECPSLTKPPSYKQCHQKPCNGSANANNVTSSRLAALTYKCLGDDWAVYCRLIREKNLCQDLRWYRRCCQTCKDFYANKPRRSTESRVLLKQ